MLSDKRILAVVPARSGSKGIPNKNMQLLNGVSLIGWAGKTLQHLRFIDCRIISTDSAEYAEEGRRYGLEAPFLRPDHLSGDKAGAIETMQHALGEAEKYYGQIFDVILIIEPTSPLRLPEDIQRVTLHLITSGADSVVTVSPLSSKSHPQKLLTIENERLGFFLPEGGQIKSRQALKGDFYWRNGVCYALTRSCLMEHQAIFTDNTFPDVMDRPIVNIDEPFELQWAEYLMMKSATHELLRSQFP